MLELQLFEEAVVASSQTIERTLKGVVVPEINRQGQCLATGGKTLLLLESIGDRYSAIGQLAKHDALSKSWRLLVAEAR